MTNFDWVKQMDFDTFFDWITLHAGEFEPPRYVDGKIINKNDVPKCYPPLHIIGRDNTNTLWALREWLKQEHKE